MRNGKGHILATLLVIGGVPCALGNVVTRVDIGSNLLGTAGYGYNANYDNIYGVQLAAVGYGAFNNTCIGNYLTCGVSYSGTTSTTGTLTASAQTATMSGTSSNIYGNVYGSQASAYAAANLATGTLGVSGSESDNSPYPYNGGGGAGTAQLSDALQFSVAGATPSTTTLITVDFAVNGSLAGAGNMNTALDFGNAAFTQTANIAAIGQAATGGPTESGWISYTVNPDVLGGNLFFSGVYALTGATANVPVFASLFAQSSSESSADYAHTATLSLILPNNVTYTSGSGVFLTSQAAAPEPGSVLLSAAGVAGLVWAMRRRKFLR